MLPLTILFAEFTVAFCVVGAIITMILLFSGFGEKKDKHEDHSQH
jgi:hypothetical protein